MRSDGVPLCPTDHLAVSATLVGWRCPLCGLASLPDAVDERSRAAHPSRRRTASDD